MGIRQPSTISPAMIDQIVAEVVRRIKTLSQASSSQTFSSKTSSPKTLSPETLSPNTLSDMPAGQTSVAASAATTGRPQVVVTGRIVTLAGVAEQLVPGAELRLSPSARLTPALADFVKEQGIAVVYGEQAAAPRPQRRLWLTRVTDGTKRQHHLSQDDQMLSRQFDVHQLEMSCPDAALAELAQPLAAGDIAILQTMDPCRVAMLANKKPEIRAVRAFEPQQVTAAGGWGANLMVICQHAAGYRVRQFVRAFVRSVREATT